MKRSILFILAITFIAIPSYASTIWDGNVGTVSTCSVTDIQYAIDEASTKNGSVIINLPKCNTTLSSSINVDMKNGFSSVSKLTIKGFGDPPEIGSTNDTVLNNGGWVINTDSDKTFRISNIKFTGNGNAYNNFLWIKGDTKPSKGGGFRVDHMNFLGGHALQIYAGDCYGVIDSNTGGTHGQFAGIIWGTDNYLGGGNISWSQISTVGEQDAVYFENNNLVQSDTTKKWMLCDGVNGARVVARYNTLTDYYLSGHDASSVGRGIFSYEGYNNTFYSTGAYKNAPLSMRGGTGVFFNNSIIADSSQPFYSDEGDGIALYNYRSFEPSIGTVSPWTSTADNIVEKACLEGNAFRSRLCNTDVDCGGIPGSCVQIDGHTDATGYPARDQIGRSTNQKSDPMLFWNNTISRNGGPAEYIHPYVPSTNAKHIKENRDYCTSNSSLPSSCNGIVTNYSPYEYPHPLRYEELSSLPKVENLRISNP